MKKTYCECLPVTSPTAPSTGASCWSRRRFLAAAAVSGAALAVAGRWPLGAAPPPAQRFKLVGFSKAFQKLSFEDTADLVAEVGWDGIECPVRAKGQVLPERVEDDLPKMVEALGKRKLELAIMTTDIRSATEPFTERVLRTARRLGIRHYRLGDMHYGADTPILAKLDEVRAKLRDLAALNKELGICAGWQNHSGSDSIGAPVWDMYSIIKDFDPQYMSVFFDIAHATLEGGLSWPVQARLMEPHFGAVYVKDFVWKRDRDGWKEEWVPLGEGMVRPAFFQWLLKSPFKGIISQHHEYAVGEGGVRQAALKKDLRTLRAWLQAQTS